MTSISNDNSALEALGLRTTEALKATEKKDDLGLDTFLELMTTQLKNQDPMKPMENGQFLGQIAQFASVTGLQQLNDSFSDLTSSLSSSQALQAGNLVGKTVMTFSPKASGRSTWAGMTPKRPRPPGRRSMVRRGCMASPRERLESTSPMASMHASILRSRSTSAPDRIRTVMSPRGW